MATTNVTLTSDWIKVAEVTDDPVLIQTIVDGAQIEVAGQDTDTAPTDISGHLFEGRGQVVTRSNLGDGYLFARAMSAPTVRIVVTK